MKILIVGGGIAGCTLAFFLNKYGFTPTVLESVPEFKHVGYLLALRETGIEMIEKMGLLEQLKKYEITFTKSIWYDIHGKLIKAFDVDGVLAEYQGMALNRADLHACLYDAVRKDVEFRFDQRIKRIDQKENEVVVTLENGETERYDLVIGADGFHSDVRRLIFGERFTKYLGQAFFAFIIPNRTHLKSISRQEARNVRGPNFFLSYGMFSYNASEVGSYVIYRAEPFVPIDVKDRHEYLQNVYGKYDEDFSNILSTMKKDDFIYHGDLSQVLMPTWHKGRVCLLGDASYCLTLSTGMGASMAMAGAYILASRLRDTKNYHDAFNFYEKNLRPDILRLQSFGVRMGKFIVADGIMPYGFTNLLLHYVPQSLISRVLLRRSTERIQLD